MGLRDAAKRIDDAVLGRSDSTRGFVFNTLSGLHPALKPVWLAVAVGCLGAAAVALIGGQPGIAVIAAFLAVTAAFMGFVARDVPAVTPQAARNSTCSWCETGRHETCTGQAVSPQVRVGWNARDIGDCSCFASGHTGAR